MDCVALSPASIFIDSNKCNLNKQCVVPLGSLDSAALDTLVPYKIIFKITKLRKINENIIFFCYSFSLSFLIFFEMIFYSFFIFLFAPCTTKRVHSCSLVFGRTQCIADG